MPAEARIGQARGIHGERERRRRWQRVDPRRPIRPRDRPPSPTAPARAARSRGMSARGGRPVTGRPSYRSKTSCSRRLMLSPSRIRASMLRCSRQSAVATRVTRTSNSGQRSVGQHLVRHRARARYAPPPLPQPAAPCCDPCTGSRTVPPPPGSVACRRRPPLHAASDAAQSPPATPPRDARRRADTIGVPHTRGRRRRRERQVAGVRASKPPARA